MRRCANGSSKNQDYQSSSQVRSNEAPKLAGLNELTNLPSSIYLPPHHLHHPTPRSAHDTQRAGADHEHTAVLFEPNRLGRCEPSRTRSRIPPGKPTRNHGNGEEPSKNPCRKRGVEDGGFVNGAPEYLDDQCCESNPEHQTQHCARQRDRDRFEQKLPSDVPSTRPAGSRRPRPRRSALSPCRPFTSTLLGSGARPRSGRCHRGSRRCHRPAQRRGGEPPHSSGHGQ